jgi:hypothetical protein
MFGGSFFSRDGVEDLNKGQVRKDEAGRHSVRGECGFEDLLTCGETGAVPFQGEPAGDCLQSADRLVVPEQPDDLRGEVPVSVRDPYRIARISPVARRSRRWWSRAPWHGRAPRRS